MKIYKIAQEKYMQRLPLIRIAKVSSEDCVAWIIQNLAPNSQPNDWKRRSKNKVGDYIVREFENVKLTQFGSKAMVKVYELNGQIVPPPVSQPNQPNQSNPQTQQKMPKQKKVYYAIGIDKMDPDDPNILVLVTDASEFNRSGSQSDYTPDGVIEELSRLGFDAAEVTESVLEFFGKVDINQLKIKLASSSLFEFNRNFQNFMMEGDCGDFEIIPI